MRVIGQSPAQSGADREGHRRQERQGPCEAHQVPFTSDSFESVECRRLLGNRAVFREGRSLALRPRLATGLPWTSGPAEEHSSSAPTMGGTSRVGHGTRVRVRPRRWGSCRPAPAAGQASVRRRPRSAAAAADGAGGVGRGARPRASRPRSGRRRRSPRSTSPMLKMLANGSQRGSAKRSVSGARAGWRRPRCSSRSSGAVLPSAASAAGVAGM